MAQRLTPAACSIIARSIVIVHSLQPRQLMGVIETTDDGGGDGA